MSSLTREAIGPFVYSMLDGDALTAVEHPEFPEIAISEKIAIFDVPDFF